MKSNILLTIYTLIICQSTAQRAFCPVRSPSNQVIYFTDKPSWSATSMLKTQCTMECSFCSNKQTCGDCRAFNYNSTSQNCSIFNFEPKSYDIDSKGEMVGYRDSSLPVPGFWLTVAAKLCAITFNGLAYYTGCTHVYKADKYCSVDRYYCELLNGTEVFCIPNKSTIIDKSVVCSFPFTYNGILYNGCAPNGAIAACLSVNRTTTILCTNYSVAGVANNTLSIGNQSVPVQSVSGWIIWMRRVASVAYNWQLPWAWYKNGFGSVGDSNYWLGLEKVSQLTSSSSYRLRVEIKDKVTGAWYSAEYWSFMVGDEVSKKYQLNVDGYSGDVTNAMTNVSPSTCGTNCANGMKFTTYDADNDLYPPNNCASLFGGGWWFASCYDECLTCSGNSFFWSYSSTNAYYLDEARIMMKPQ